MSRHGLLRIVLLLTATTSTYAITKQEPWYRGSSSVYSSTGNPVEIRIPHATQEGDLLILTLSRTDDMLPMALQQEWTPSASCFKNKNGQQHCHTLEQCTDKIRLVDPDYVRRDYCTRFENRRNGNDLNTIIFTRKMIAGESGALLSWKFLEGNPLWVTLTAARGVSEKVRDWAGVTCDQDVHSTFQVPPKTQPGDLLFLSMAFDDSAQRNQFTEPAGTSMLSYITGIDEAGFVYAEPVGFESLPQRLVTGGPGGPECKDLMLSVAFISEDTDDTSATKSLPIASTPRPTPTPTRRPTPTPTRRPTPTPTRRPSPMPTPQPIQTDTSNNVGDKNSQTNPKVEEVRQASSSDQVKLGHCEGDCDSNDHCAGDLVCWQRSGGEYVPGCYIKGASLENNSDFCVYKADADEWDRLRRRALRGR